MVPVEKNDKFIVFEGMPIPPSDNAIKKPVQRYKKGSSYKILSFVSTNEYEIYKLTLAQWLSKNEDKVKPSVKAIKALFDSNTHLSIRAVFYLKRERIFTKKGEIKKFDVTNRLKALHDTFCTFCCIDDKIFFHSSAEKIETINEERVDIFISEII
jgi:Holliday junction resolvase RusA-like endonuclease